MAGGLMTLVAEGNQNVILNGNPSKTFFKSTYKKYTNFAMQKFRLDYVGLRQLHLNQDTKLTFKVKRYADLLHDTYLVLNLPNIYSPIYPFSCDEDSSRINWTPYEFKWIKNIGTMIIREIEVVCGSLTIQKISGEYLHALINRDINKQKKLYDAMTGNLPYLYDPGNYGFRNDTYPNAVYNNGETVEPSIRGRKLYIPLNLWFCLNTQQAIPLCAIQYQELEIKITLRPICDLFTIRDVTDTENDYPVIKPNFNLSEHAFYRFIHEPIDPSLEPNGYTDKSTMWNQDIHLIANYIFLTEEERAIYSTYEQSYLFKEIHEYKYYDIIGSKRQKIETQGLIANWMFLFQRNDVYLRNQWSNYTNWLYDYLPNDIALASEIGTYCSNFAEGRNRDNTHSFLYATGNYSDENTKNILLSLGILLNGEYRENIMDAGVYKYVEPYYKSSPSFNPNSGIYEYNFDLYTTPFILQPSGAANLSKYANIEVELNTITPPVNDDAVFNVICNPITKEVIGVKKPSWKLYDYTFTLTLLEERYNVLIISNGNCSLLHAR